MIHTQVVNSLLSTSLNRLDWLTPPLVPFPSAHPGTVPFCSAAQLSAALEAQAHYQDGVRARALVAWRQWNARRQELRENYRQVVAARHKGRLRAAFAHWHALAAQRALLVRVFSRAWDAWEDARWLPEHHYEFDLMGRTLATWRGAVARARERRTEEAREMAAEAYRETALAHKALSGLRLTREGARAVERSKRAIFRAWWARAAVEALDFGVASGRAILREKGYGNEMEYDRLR